MIEALASQLSRKDRPLANLKAIEFTHMVMGPTVGLILADLGADVIKIEPVSGDTTRRLVGSGAGYFPMYNRNKRSIALDLKSERGLEIARKLCLDADIVVENFRPGTIDRLGLGYESLAAENHRLIFCSQKGFLDGPYAHRTALDEVAQMMGGLAYMTGPPGRPLRAGASVIDVLGGIFGVVGILAAVEERHRTGKGQRVTSSLYESSVFLVGQHMAQYAVTGEPAAPMPVRKSAWAIYDIFKTGDDEELFVGVVSDSQWKVFCDAFGLNELGADESLRTNAARVENRPRILEAVQTAFSQYSKADLMAKLEDTGLPFAPIAKPHELDGDTHLIASEGLVDITLDDGTKAKLPSLPLAMDGRRFSLFHDLPKTGEDSRAVLAEIGIDDEAYDALVSEKIVAGSRGTSE